MSDSQGAKANKNGKILEDSITPALESRNFLVIEFKKQQTRLPQDIRELQEAAK